MHKAKQRPKKKNKTNVQGANNKNRRTRGNEQKQRHVIDKKTYNRQHTTDNRQQTTNNKQKQQTTNQKTHT